MVSFIDEHRGTLGVEPICKALQVAPSTYYAAKSRQPSPRALRDAIVKNILFVLWTTNRKARKVAPATDPPRKEASENVA